jgi:tetratricopeptide (TPR) repeat protein
MNRPLAIVAFVAAWAAATAYGADSVKTLSGTVTGKLTAMSATEVTVETAASGKKTIPVNEIEVIHYEGETPYLKSARAAVASGRYQVVLDSLGKIKDAELERRPEIQQDVEFYRAVANARLALAGQGELAEAGTALAAFVTGQPNSYHHLAACELAGDLLVASQKPEAAQPYYDELGKAPWPDYQMRAGVAMGRALLATKKYDEAMRTFQEVLDKPASGETAERQRLAATLGKTRCLIEMGKAEDAIAVTKGLIETTDAGAAELYAKAYNTLGLAYRKAGRPQDALMAFLHTDVLYSASREDHIEALRNLVELWRELQKPDRAAQTQEQLNQLK